MLKAVLCLTGAKNYDVRVFIIPVILVTLLVGNRADVNPHSSGTVTLK